MSEPNSAWYVVSHLHYVLAETKAQTPGIASARSLCQEGTQTVTPGHCCPDFQAKGHLERKEQRSAEWVRVKGDNPCSLGESASSSPEINLSIERAEMFPRYADRGGGGGTRKENVVPGFWRHN